MGNAPDTKSSEATTAYAVGIASVARDYSPVTVTMQRRVRGPSNSQKKIACHVPSTILPPATGTAALQPTRELFTCAAELPSPYL